MSKYGKMVLWMGLVLMALQIAAEWSFIRAELFTGGTSSKGSSGGSIPNPFGILPPGLPILPIITMSKNKTAPKAAK